MTTLNIYGENRLANYTKTRIACRGVIIRDDKILLTYEVNTDQYFIPGGGLEEGETIEQCCIRELAEETGIVVQPTKQFLTINEYYSDWLFVSHYFVCKPIGTTCTNLTDAERAHGLETRWVNIDQAIAIFAKHQDYATQNEMKRGAYLREYTALSKL